MNGENSEQGVSWAGPKPAAHSHVMLSLAEGGTEVLKEAVSAESKYPFVLQ